jgi:hypothetical protein
MIAWLKLMLYDNKPLLNLGGDDEYTDLVS